MSDMTFQINRTEFHRNGVGGDPFYTIDFVLTEYDSHQQLWAVVPASNSDDEDERLAPAERWQIIDPTNFDTNWRGDSIGYQLKPLAESYLKDKYMALGGDILAGRL